MKRVPLRFYARDARDVAPDLLNKLLVVGGRSGRIVETEAYCGSIDPGAHSYRGRTPRTEVMFGPPGRLYVYLSYGMHWCCNPVCGPEGEGWAVLIRAVEPVAGVEEMRPLRPRATRDVELTNGPGKLTQALGIVGEHNGADLVTGADGVRIADDGMAPPGAPVVTSRIGFGENPARDFPWRWFVPNSPYVSRRAGAR
ncbi:MAG: DNA-3-methyladenine glycosylase [Actinomycetota bacterium]|nr:DNA-3-methyladenine glycosylase [Actinomycetota bacterium]